MADDFSNRRDEYDKQARIMQERVDAGSIDQRDADAITDWMAYQEGMKEISTLVGYFKNLRLAAERFQTPLVEADADTINREMSQHLSGTHPAIRDGGLSKAYVRQIQLNIRKFYEYHDHLGVDKEDIKAYPKPDSPVDETDVYDSDDVDEMLDAAPNERDRAFVATLLSTCQRITALATLKIKHVDLDSAPGTIYLNDEAIGLKGASGKRPLLWAKPYMARWLSVHPCKNDPEAYVFTALQSARNTDPGDMLSYNALRKRLKVIGEKIDIDKPMNPHNFRHTGISRLAAKGISEQRIKYMAGWSADSTQLKTYSHVNDDKHMAGIAEDFGIEMDKDDIGQPSLDECPQCDTPIRIAADFCPGCGLALDDAGLQKREEIEGEMEDDMWEAKGEAETESQEEAVDAAHELLEQEDVRSAMMNELKEDIMDELRDEMND